MHFLSDDEKNLIHDRSLEILAKVGVMVKNTTARDLLASAGCSVTGELVRFPASLVGDCIKSVPNHFDLFSRDGVKVTTVGNDRILYNPGSSVPNFMDRDTGEMRKATSQDLEDAIIVTDRLANIEAQSTAIIPSDIPHVISDFYRLYLVLKHSSKPIITGAFRKEGLADMIELIKVFDRNGNLSEKPCAIFDCCPTSPLTWGDTSAQNLIDCANMGIPAEIVPAPLMGATSPITIAGTIAQVNAEILSGIVMSQIANAGSPVVYGGAPAPLDMRYATPAYGAIETVMTACAASEMGKHYGIPTHAYLGVSDAKAIDTQLGFESAVGLVIGAVSRVNVISGPGTLAYINCLSLEKLVIDNEICGSALRLARGIDFDDFDIITNLMEKVGHTGDFLKQRHTSKKLRGEHLMPSDVIDRKYKESQDDTGRTSTFERAQEHVNAILEEKTESSLDSQVQQKLHDQMKALVAKYDVLLAI